MPYQAPGSLSADDTYAVTAYILSLNGIVPEVVIRPSDCLMTVFGWLRYC
jgi:hypothetical protein